MKKLGDYMFVRDAVPSITGKTRIWRIVDRNDGTLGFIKWFGRWRCYAFFPDGGTIFNASCMKELVSFCEDATAEQRKK